MTTFSAADSALGYLYQVRVALLWSLRRARAGADFRLKSAAAASAWVSLP